MFGSKNEPQPHATISEGAIKRVDELLKDGARAKAELQVLRENEKRMQDRVDYLNCGQRVEAAEAREWASHGAQTSYPFAEKVSSVTFTKTHMPRLEPYHAEVKAKQKSAGMTEKEADTAVRKELLHDAIQSITDHHLRSFLVALLTLI